MPTLDDRLLPTFAGQHWMVSLDDVLAAGGTQQQAAARVASGRWASADVGVYRLKGMPTSWHARLLAPILSVGLGIAGSHLAAAAVHGVPSFGRGAPEVTVERGIRLRRAGVRVHTSTDLRRRPLVIIDGIPVTDLPRTLLDIGRVIGDQRLHRAIEWGRRERGLSWGDLVETLAQHARRGRPGIRRLRRVIAAHAHREEITDSDFELLVLALIRERGLLEPVLHHQVFDGERFVAEVDLAYPHRRVAIELDGSIHLERDVRERDLPRQNDLVLRGWTVLRFTWRAYVERPDTLVREIRAALRSETANL
jgi:very-short-patch-repair endonuclease